MDRGSWLTSPMVLFMIWSILTFVVRSWARLRTKNWVWDDWTITLALMSALTHVIITFDAIQHGYGRPLSELPQSAIGIIDQCLFAADLTYIIVLGLSKISVALFIAHLSDSLRSSPPYLLATVAVVWTMTSTLILGLHGDKSWTTAKASEKMHVRWLGIEVSGLIIELALWLLSIRLVWNLQMRLQKRLSLVGAFGFRLLMIPIIVSRLIYLSPEHNTNPTITTIVPNIITEAAMQFSIISASVTSLKPFLKPLHPACMVPSAGESSTLVSTDRAITRGDIYYRLEPLEPVAKPNDRKSRGQRVSIIGGQRDVDFGSDQELNRRS